jgi:hypothetical protein
MANEIQTQWAVLNSNNQRICNYSAIEKTDESGHAETPTIPIEGGKLAAFNKISRPDEETLILLFDGDYANQEQCLAQIRQAKDSTALFKIVSPAGVLRNMSLNNYSVSRAHDSGGHLMIVECNFLEVKSVDQTKQAWSGKRVTAATPKNTGQTQTNSVLKDTAGFKKG